MRGAGAQGYSQNSQADGSSQPLGFLQLVLTVELLEVGVSASSGAGSNVRWMLGLTCVEGVLMHT